MAKNTRFMPNVSRMPRPSIPRRRLFELSSAGVWMRDVALSPAGKGINARL